jgi:hypothetical protein
MGVADLIVLITFFAVLLPLGRALVRRLEHGPRRVERDGPHEAMPSGMSSADIEGLRRQVAELTDRVDRMAEEQDFLVRLLEERPALQAPKPEGERSSGS